eukprot:COSAG02_NODE_48628_length_332_cov_0.884120_1_plen_66_part_10
MGIIRRLELLNPQSALSDPRPLDCGLAGRCHHMSCIASRCILAIAVATRHLRDVVATPLPPATLRP